MDEVIHKSSVSGMLDVEKIVISPESMHLREINTVAERLRFIRRIKGMGVAELSRQTGLSRTTLIHIEDGSSIPIRQTVAKIEDALALPEGWLTSGPTPEGIEADRPPEGTRVYTTHPITRLSRWEFRPRANGYLPKVKAERAMHLFMKACFRNGGFEQVLLKLETLAETGQEVDELTVLDVMRRMVEARRA